jgi:indolepyruvate ferredoxin oxidoreductase alpha subunit
MDNAITAMTGHQPNPSSVVKIEAVARALGAEVRVASAFSYRELIKALEELEKVKGPRVLVSQGECRLITKRKFRKKGITLPKFEIVDQKEFEKSKLLEDFACPAFEKTKKGYRINPDLCWGCGVCAQLCPKGIKAKK